MLSRADSLKSELVDHIADLAQQRLGPGRGELAARFIRWLYANVPPNDLISERPDNLYGAALSMLSFAEQRTPGTPNVRVYTPRLDQHGWHSAHTIIEIINEDMPFLVDSVTMELNRADANVRLIIHPIFVVERNARGSLVQLHPAEADNPRAGAESFMHVKIRAQPPERMADLAKGIERVLADVRTAVEDFDAMRDRCRQVAAELRASPPPIPEPEVGLTAAFLEWLNENHFTYLGYRRVTFLTRDEERRVSVYPEEGLGLLQDANREIVDGYRATAPGEFLRIFKANHRSTVHRPVHMDVISVPRYDDTQQVCGEHLFVGLFTLAAYSRSPEFIPVLREKIERTLRRSGYPPRSHNGKALRYILETYPRDELFQITDDDLLAIATGILYLQARERVALFVRTDPFERFVSCLVFVPRDRFDTRIRLRIQDILARAFEGGIAAYYTYLGDEALARLHLIVRTPQGRLPDVDLPAVERKIYEVTRSWEDRLEETLINEHGEERGTALARRYARAFPAGYREDFDELTAVHDLDFVERALATGELAMNLYRRVEAKPYELHFKLHSPHRYVPLSDVLPMLENMGLRVIAEVPYDVRPNGADTTVWTHDFYVETESHQPVDLTAIKDTFQETFGRVVHGDTDDDGFNKLVLHAGLSVRDIEVFRAYSKYLRQLQVPFSQAYMQQTLHHNPEIACDLIALFAARFDPEHTGEACEAIRARLDTQLDAVVSLDEDRILRQFLNAIEATVRTNFYQRGTAGDRKAYAFKIDCGRIDEMPAPRPLWEIFVFSTRMEGVHQRFGKVARGGLRWSDRIEDFRTEILGLVKAQQVKNAVIVPVGSKGGFVLKKAPPPEAGRDAALKEGIACYETFIRGLLDVTDNLSGAEVLVPDRVVRHDGDDAYLVVAADKGTATFSDIANRISADYGFWLDDAFASGGSAGYDHKKMGITARGAWESVKRHFREIGKNIQAEPFTCVGVGDMSGDVFGNGMLLSRHTRLIAAFNHLHVFVDPDPDPEASWRERKRLFDMPRSTWRDYDPALISRGGGVFERSAKSIRVTPEMAAVLGLPEGQVTPGQLIRAILAAPVELLWFGGIGTYVKHPEESHAEVGDRANDAVRLDASQVRAQVVGEGANLAVTQSGRVAYALAGGRINTDFIDNSAGVDTSDHEVNIKILLGEIERAGDLTRKQRDMLLRQMTDEVAELVLRDNYLQTQALSVARHLGTHIVDRLNRFIHTLERTGVLDRTLESLPDDETIGDRLRQGEAFTRPELAVLLAYSKNGLYEQLLASASVDDAYLTRELVEYFPGPLRERYAQEIQGHRLRREIVATVIGNDIVNRMGVTYVQSAEEKSGMPIDRVALAYLAARDVLKVASIWQQIESLDNQVKASTQAGMLVECSRLVDRVSVWLLREHGAALDPAAVQERYAAGIAQLTERLPELISDADRANLSERLSALQHEGVPEPLAARVASLPLLAPACDIVSVADLVSRSVPDVARVYFAVGHRFGFEWLRRVARHLPTDRTWDKQAVEAVVDDLSSGQRDLALRVLREADTSATAQEAIDAWGAPRRALLGRTTQLMNELEASPSPDFAMLAVASRHLRALVSG